MRKTLLGFCGAGSWRSRFEPGNSGCHQSMLSQLASADSCGTVNPLAQFANSLNGPIVRDSRAFSEVEQVHGGAFQQGFHQGPPPGDLLHADRPFHPEAQPMVFGQGPTLHQPPPQHVDPAWLEQFQHMNMREQETISPSAHSPIYHPPQQPHFGGMPFMPMMRGGPSHPMFHPIQQRPYRARERETDEYYDDPELEPEQVDVPSEQPMVGMCLLSQN